jgi:myosin heavy subunit
MEKNRDTLYTTIENAVASSNNPLLVEMFNKVSAAALATQTMARPGRGGGGKSKPKTAGFQFKANVNSLIGR